MKLESGLDGHVEAEGGDGGVLSANFAGATVFWWLPAPEYPEKYGVLYFGLGSDIEEGLGFLQFEYRASLDRIDGTVCPSVVITPGQLRLVAQSVVLGVGWSLSVTGRLLVI